MYTTQQIFTFFSRTEYDRRDCIVIERAKDEFGGLLNMTGGYPLVVNDIEFRTLEHLYQCLRLPSKSGLQKRIMSKKSPLLAKWISKPHRHKGRPDWFQVKFAMMWWCLHVKLAQHYDTFGSLLDSTGNKVIVETSPNGDLWGGVPSRVKSKPYILVGSNVLGKLLMKLREEYRTKSRRTLTMVEPLDIKDFRLLGKPIRRIVRE